MQKKKNGKLAISTVLSTVILTASLLAIVSSAYLIANNAVNYHIENSHFDAAKNTLESLAKVVKKIMFTSHSSGYVRTNLMNTIPQFLETGESLNLTVVDDGVFETTILPINLVRIKGGSKVGVLIPKIIFGNDELVLIDPSGSLGLVNTLQSDGAWVKLDYERARCVYVGSSDYFNGDAYEKRNIVEITMLNLTKNVFNATGTQATIYVENLGSSSEQVVSASKNFTVYVSSPYSGSQDNCTLQDLIANLSQEQKDEILSIDDVLIKIIVVNIEVSMVSGG